MSQPTIEIGIQAPAFGPSLTAQLDGLEVVQAVQDLNGTVPLVEEKRTFVRAYLGGPAGVTMVRGELEVARKKTGPWRRISSFGTAELDASRTGSTLAQLRSRRENLAFSLDFLLPEKYTDDGTLWLRLGEVRDAGTGRRVQITDPVGAKTVEFLEAPELRLRVVNLRYTTGTPPVQHQATQSDLDHLESWLGRAYPVEEVEFSAVTVNATATWPFIAVQANAQVAAIRALDVASGGDPGRHYYGIVSDGGGFMRGQASAIPGTPDPSAVASGPTGPAGFPWDTDGSYGDWYGGHELAHTLGRRHPGFCQGQGNDDPAYPFPNGQLSGADGAFTGLDVGDPELGIQPVALPGATWHDVMTYCDNQWVSSYVYTGIRDRLLAEEELFPEDDDGRQTMAEAAGTPAGTAIHVVAVVNLTARTADLSFVTPLPSTPMLPPVPTEGRLELRIRRTDGTTYTEPVVFKPQTCQDPGEDEVGLVDTVVHVQPDTDSLELMLDGEPVAEVHDAGQPTTVDDLRVERRNGGAALDAGGTESAPLLTWNAPDRTPGLAQESGTPVTYAVQVSADEGRTWSTLAVGLTDTQVALDPRELTDHTTVRFRVLASTAFTQAVAVTEDMPIDDL